MTPVPVTRRFRLSRDARVLLGVIATGFVVLLALRAASASKPSSLSNRPRVLPTPVVTQDGQCADFAKFWSYGGGISVDPRAISAIGRCRQDAAGAWILVDRTDDRRLPAAQRPTADEMAAAQPLRLVLLLQIGALEMKVPSELTRHLSGIYDPQSHPVTGHVRDGVFYIPTRARYTRMAQSFLMSPDYRLLADYVGWTMGVRIDAYRQFATACRPASGPTYLVDPCNLLEDALGVRYPPFIWDMRDPLNLDGYLLSLVRSGTLPGIDDKLDASPTP